MPTYTKVLRFAAILMFFTLPAAGLAVADQEARTPNVPDLRQAANRAFVNKDYPAFLRALDQLRGIRPYNSDYMYQQVLAYSLLDQKRAAYNLMLSMQRQGLSYDFSNVPEAQNIQGTELFTYINDLMVAAGQPLGKAGTLATLPVDVRLPEAITWDAGREALLVGTVHGGDILAVSKDGISTNLFKADGSWGIYGLKADPRNNHLWATTAANAHFSGFDPSDKGRSMLLEFALDSMELLRRYPVPVDGNPHSLGSLDLAPNGDLYVADSLLPIIYVLKAADKKLQPLFFASNLVSLRGLAVSADGRLLYVADHELGITVFDIEGKRSTPLTGPETLNLGGIEGVYFWQDQLVVIQNGIRPQRVMSLTLEPDGFSVAGVAPVVVALPGMDSPTFGTVVGTDLYFFANSQWGRRSGNPQPVTIAIASLSDVPLIVDADAQRLMQQYEESLKQGKVREASPAGNEAAQEPEKN